MTRPADVEMQIADILLEPFKIAVVTAACGAAVGSYTRHVYKDYRLKLGLLASFICYVVSILFSAGALMATTENWKEVESAPSAPVGNTVLSMYTWGISLFLFLLAALLLELLGTAVSTGISS